MKGLELSRAYFESYGLPMLEEQFSEVMRFLSAGLVGSGSEVLGYDDEMIARLTFRELVCIPGVDYEIAENVIKVVISKYVALYKQPKVILRTRDDIRQTTNLFFSEHK